jgi:hypothetical protein
VSETGDFSGALYGGDFSIVGAAGTTAEARVTRCSPTPLLLGWADARVLRPGRIVTCPAPKLVIDTSRRWQLDDIELIKLTNRWVV